MTTIGSDVDVPVSNCTNCGHKCDAAFGIGDDARPSPGDFTLCIMCGHLMCFTEALELRDPTPQEVAAIAGDKNLVQASRALHELHKDMRENPDKYGVSGGKKTG